MAVDSVVQAPEDENLHVDVSPNRSRSPFASVAGAPEPTVEVGVTTIQATGCRSR